MDRRDFLRMTAVAAGGALLGRHSEAAPPTASHDTELSFVVVADPHLREDREGEPTGVAKFRRALGAIERLSPRPAFMLLLGDIHPEKLVPIMGEVAIPVHPVHGNHETLADRGQLRELFASNFSGRDYYAFSQGACRFIGLCTATVGDHIGHFESEDITPATGQVEWLEQELHATRDMAHRFIFAHIPPDPQSRPNRMCLGSRESLYFHALLQRHRVSACFFGHLHSPADYSSAGCRMLTVASCNWNFGGKPPGLLFVRVRGEHVGLEFISTAG